MTANGIAALILEEAHATDKPEPRQEAGQLRAKPSHRLPILSLVDREYLHSTANLPRMAWEPLSYLYSEADSQTASLELMDVPEKWEWVRERGLDDWNKMHRWLDQLLLDSQSVEALRSWQMVGGLQTVHGDIRRPSATQMPDFPQPHHPGNAPAKRGLRVRGG